MRRGISTVCCHCFFPRSRRPGETTVIRENGAASGIGAIGTIAYDNLGRRTSLTLGNGVATTYAYDPLSRLDELKLEFAGSADDLTTEFNYNPAGQIASNLRSNDAYAWTSHGSGTTSTTSNGLNQIAGWVSTLGYDAKGNITTDGTYTYTYSSENLLTSLTNPAGTQQTSSTYAYDPLMRLAKIDSSNSVFDSDLGYDGQEIVLEGLSNSRTRRYVFGPGVDEPLVAYLVTSTGTTRSWYHADERGSTIRQTDDSGNPGGGIGRYDEYGVGPGSSRFQYTGQYWLGEAGLHYYRARVYDPKLGRFLQPDPIGYEGGMNLYAYVRGDPTNATDPSGTLDCGLESNWRSGNCADRAVARHFREIALGEGYSDSQIRAATNSILDYLHGRIDYVDLTMGLLKIEAGADAGQASGNRCPGPYQCDDTPNRQMRQDILALLRNESFISAVKYAAQQSAKTGNEWGFTGKGRGDFRLVGGFIQGARDAISADIIAQRVRMGADLFFHIHPNFGREFSPGLSYGRGVMVYGGDLGVAYQNGILVGAYAFSSENFYWFEGKGLRR